MNKGLGPLPVMVKLSALSLGTPLVLMGLVLMMSDLEIIVKQHSLSAAGGYGLVSGPIFAVVGLSFLWPLRPFTNHSS
jgi:hypothetical protein